VRSCPSPRPLECGQSRSQRARSAGVPRRAGELLAAAGLSNALDAGIALLAHRVGGVVVTSDRDDLELLAGALADPPTVVTV
jgi:predicted nuclease of predicted toxin-antitoxin system